VSTIQPASDGLGLNSVLSSDRPVINTMSHSKARQRSKYRNRMAKGDCDWNEKIFSYLSFALTTRIKKMVMGIITEKDTSYT